MKAYYIESYFGETPTIIKDDFEDFTTSYVLIDNINEIKELSDDCNLDDVYCFSTKKVAKEALQRYINAIIQDIEQEIIFDRNYIKILELAKNRR